MASITRVWSYSKSPQWNWYMLYKHSQIGFIDRFLNVKTELLPCIMGYYRFGKSSVFTLIIIILYIHILLYSKYLKTIISKIH
jgi:hypothetical protein